MVSAPSDPSMSSTSMNFRATVSSFVTRQVTREYIVELEKCKPVGIPVVYLLAGFLPVPRVTADSAGRRSCQGWPEATAERLGLDGEKPCGHLPAARGRPHIPFGFTGVTEPVRWVGASCRVETRWSRSRQAGSYSSRGS